jgi:hypothetical protein
MKGETSARVHGHFVRIRFRLSLGTYDTEFQVEVYASLACVHEINLREDQRACEYLL